MRILGDYIDKYNKELFKNESIKFVEFLRLICNKRFV